MSIQERQKLKTAMNTFKSTKRNYPQLHSQLRDEAMRAIVNARTPEWGGLNVVITKAGV